jgi:type I restriction enzyme S subunit
MGSEVPSGWSRTRLGHVTELAGGTTPSRSELAYWGGGIGWVTPTDITSLAPGVMTIHSTADTISELGLKANSLNLLPPGTVLMTSRASIGEAVVTQVPITTNQGFCNFLPSNNADSLFLAYWLRHHTQHFKDLAAGSTFLEINRGTVRKVSILLPPHPEQKKIAAILSSVDEAIQATQGVIEQTRRVKEGLLQDLLTKGIGHTRFKQTEIGEIPEGWEVSTVGHALSVQNSKRKPISREVRATMPGPYPYWGPTRIQDHINEYQFDGDYSLVGEDGDHFLKWQQSEMTMWATGRFNVNNHAHVLGSTPKCRARWFFYYYMHRDLRRVLTRQGAGRYKLTKAALVGLPIALPPMPEQDEIIGIMDACLESPIQGDAGQEGLYHLKAGLLQDLLTGKVRVAA